MPLLVAPRRLLSSSYSSFRHFQGSFLRQRFQSVSTLILLRHGQSQWNGPDARFTGWADVPLTVRGRVQAVAAGQLLRAKGFHASRVDVAFTSQLQRAHETCELALASMAGPDQHTWSSDRIRRDVRLNERHYGAVQGLAKNDPEVLKKYGTEAVLHWRRSMDGKPPPLDETHPYWSPDAPLTESLADCQQRALDCFHHRIAPALFDEQGLPTPPDQRTVVVVAHSNTIRSLMAAFDNIPAAQVPRLHVPNSVPILYRFDRATRRIVSSKLQAAAGGSHARWLLSAENHRAVRQALQPGGLLTRALLDAILQDDRRGGSQALFTAADISRGLDDLLRDEQMSENDEMPADWVVIALAKKISRELKPGESITRGEFERRAAEAVEAMLQQQQANRADAVVPAAA